MSHRPASLGFSPLATAHVAFRNEARLIFRLAIFRHDSFRHATMMEYPKIVVVEAALVGL